MPDQVRWLSPLGSGSQVLEDPLKLFWIAIVGIALLLCSFTFYRCAGDQLAIDRCLDSGGQWNYDAKRCEGAGSS